MIGLLVQILILALVAGLIWWLLTLLPLPEPFALIVRVVFVIIMIVILLSFVAPVGWNGPLLR